MNSMKKIIFAFVAIKHFIYGGDKKFLKQFLPACSLFPDNLLKRQKPAYCCEILKKSIC